MATNILPSSTAARIQWMARRIEEAQYDNAMGMLIGTGPKSPIMEIPDLRGKKKGYKVEGIHIFNAEPTPGQSGWTASDVGTEQDLSPYLDTLELTYYTKGIDVGYVAQEQYQITNLEEAAKKMSEKWVSHWIEGGVSGYTGLIDLLLTAPNTSFYGGTATSTATLADGDTLDIDDLTDIEAALDTGESQAGTAGVKFTKADFLGYTDSYAMIANQHVYAGLKRSTDWKTIQANAQMRGDTNAFWNQMVRKHVVGKVGNIVLIQSDRLPTYSTGGAGSNVRYGAALILGSQAGLYGQGMTLPPVEYMNEDKSRVFVYNKMIMGIKATTLNSVQHNCAAGYYALVD